MALETTFCKLCRFLCKHHYVNKGNRFGIFAHYGADVGDGKRSWALYIGEKRIYAK